MSTPGLGHTPVIQERRRRAFHCVDEVFASRPFERWRTPHVARSTPVICVQEECQDHLPSSAALAFQRSSRQRFIRRRSGNNSGTVATFGFLEEVLGKAIFAFTATTEYSEEEARKALAKWHKQLEQALTDTLWPSSEVFGKVVREHQDADFKNVGELVEDIKKASKVRNALCHGSWHAMDASGKTDVYYFDKKDGKFETRIDIAWLEQVHAHVVDLICAVINSVTVMGWEFPGGAGPGEVIWPK